ncbi:MAG: polyphosphate kinase 2 family protein [Candidatus Eremiobacteraeota bacterium]|nr:polyphosphate kinase 2 family protein [Candidatus Eremiobacteraeota bacterium]
MNLKHTTIPPGESVDLERFDPADRCGLSSKEDSEQLLQADVRDLTALQEIFAARKERALLIVLQGMDAAGKDGIIKHVMSGINPQGVDVHGFRQPSAKELAHDFLWRESKVLPQFGRIGIFNRSYYEEVLVVRVNREALEAEGEREAAESWHERYEDINAFERHLVRSGTIVLKFFLHLSKEEQRKRLLARLDDRDKLWKFSDADLDGHMHWDAYQRAYSEMLAGTSTTWAPWHIVPADRKWVSRAVVGEIVLSALRDLPAEYPKPSKERIEKSALLARALEGEAEKGEKPSG